MTFSPGDQVRVREGDLAASEGKVVSHEEAHRRFEQAGRTMLPEHVIRGCVWVELFTRRGRVPVPFPPFMLDHFD